MAKFAESTTVSVEKSRAEIEKLITRYGATSTAFMNAPGRAIVCFEATGRRIMFELKLPDQTEKRFLMDGRGSPVGPAKRLEKWEQACRQCWRALALVISKRASMTFEQVVLAAIPGADAATVEHILWGRTPFPMGAITARSLYKAATRFERACKNGRQLCDFCDRLAVGKFFCDRCAPAFTNGER